MKNWRCDNVAMTHHATLNYTPTLVRQSVWAHWKKVVGITWTLVLVLLTGYMVVIVREGQTGWTVGVFGTIVALSYLFLVVLYVTHLRHGTSTLRAMGQPQATLDIDDAGFAVAAGAGQATLPWRGVQENWCYPSFWPLMLSRSQFITLPVGDLPEAMQASILERVQQHDGKVR